MTRALGIERGGLDNASTPGAGSGASAAALRRAFVLVAIETNPSTRPIAAAITIGQLARRARGLGVDSLTLFVTGESLGGGMDSMPRADHAGAGDSGGGGRTVEIL